MGILTGARRWEGGGAAPQLEEEDKGKHIISPAFSLKTSENYILMGAMCCNKRT
jgi:hypothetical protein